MDRFLSEMVESIPSVIRNAHFNINLSGWPAATSVFAVCGTVVMVCAMNTYQAAQ